MAGLRSLLMQALHPLAMAGVDQHSGWRRDPVGRLAATSAYLTTVTFGERAAARHAAARVRRIHDRVRGIDAVTGRRYAAGDPALLLWVHAALVDSVVAAASLAGTALAAGDGNRYVAEMVTAAELIGVPRPLVPSSVPELDLYIASVRPGLRCTPAAAGSMACLLDPPGLDEEAAAIWQDVRDAAVAALPRWARQMYGVQRHRLCLLAAGPGSGSPSASLTPCSPVSPACSRHGSGSPCGCGRRGRHEAHQAPRRGGGGRRGPGPAAPPARTAAP